MSSKKVGSGKDSSKKKRMLSVELKQEIIEKHERGVRVMELAKIYDRTKVGYPRRNGNLLLLWIKEKELAGDTLTETVISEKARIIYNDLKQKEPSTSTDVVEPEFKASNGWFDRFKKRSGIHSVVRHGKAASAEQKAAGEFITRFAQLIEAECYIPQKVFHCNETGLFWKKMSRRTYITAEEKKMPGHKPMKDRLTLALCANASGDFKVKPLLVYHSENPRAFKTHRILKEKLHVMWRANPKAWVTRQFFIDLVNLCFGPAVKKYLQENKLLLQALLVLDNAPAHPPSLQDNIREEYQFLKVLYLPPNTTSVLQLMDQQVISNFKKLYTKHLFKRCFDVTENTELTLREFWKEHFNIMQCLRMIDLAWKEVTRRTLNSAWKKLWPDAVAARDFEGFGLDTETKTNVPDVDPVHEIVSLGKSMGLQGDEGDINELVEEHEEELSTQELLELQDMQRMEALQEISGSKEEVETEEISTSEIKEVLGMWEKVASFIEKKHPEKMATSRSAANFDDSCLAHFR
ncbi:tigger transposable element-derived protein 1-like [Polypterus senegalus]|uniref:tigger transposable element-derived protein 1-like n=1 Tax=Polypterus senegalus TaxID=55291 RepID=UPI0019642CA9|nr:tigger transposable element-derived protein 1-like [Polypterus senegalus]